MSESPDTNLRDARNIVNQYADYLAESLKVRGVDPDVIVAARQETNDTADEFVARRLRKAQTERDEAQARLARVEALLAEWQTTTYKLPPGYPMTVNRFCIEWFKTPLREALGGDE